MAVIIELIVPICCSLPLLPTGGIRSLDSLVAVPNTSIHLEKDRKLARGDLDFCFRPQHHSPPPRKMKRGTHSVVFYQKYCHFSKLCERSELVNISLLFHSFSETRLTRRITPSKIKIVTFIVKSWAKMTRFVVKSDTV